MPFGSTDLSMPEFNRNPSGPACPRGHDVTWELDGWYWDKQNGESRCRVVADYAKNHDPYAHAATYFRTDRQTI